MGIEDARAQTESAALEATSRDAGIVRTATPVPVSTPPTPPGGPSIRRTPLFETMNADRYQRQSLIDEIEKMTGATLLCLISNHGQIQRMHTIALVDLLHNVGDNTPIDLLLNSPGGDIDVAEKLVTLIRQKAGTSRLRVIVPDYAKSAATLIALGASEIVMSNTSELGPIDPQFTLIDSNGAEITHSAQSYVDTYEEYATKLRETPNDPVARLMLEKLDPVVLEKFRRATKRSTAIATEMLQSAMISESAEAAAVAERLSDIAKWHSHGQMIGHERCRGAGLTISYQDPRTDLWERLWRLYCLQQYALGGNLTLFESRVASVCL